MPEMIERSPFIEVGRVDAERGLVVGYREEPPSVEWTRNDGCTRRMTMVNAALAKHAAETLYRLEAAEAVYWKAHQKAMDRHRRAVEPPEGEE